VTKADATTGFPCQKSHTLFPVLFVEDRSKSAPRSSRGGIKMKLRRLLTSAGVVAAVVGATVVVAPMASASGGVGDPIGGSSVGFDSYGEILSVYDTAADGHSAVGDIERWDGQNWQFWDRVWNSNGNSNTPVTANYSFPEGQKVRYRACLGEASTRNVFRCSQWAPDTA
jgi:hypothetical protein